MTDNAETGRLISLVLDASDPRLTATEREAAVSDAIAVDPQSGLAAATGMLHGVLSGIRKQAGPEALDAVMRQLAAVSLAAVGDVS